MQDSLKAAAVKVLTSIFTLSPLMFIFQAKAIGYYITQEVRWGGASYVATGRGLPTERRAIITNGSKGFEGLFLDYVNIAYYDGVLLLTGALLVVFAGGTDVMHVNSSDLAWTWLSLGLTLASWLYAPFIFNPYNFRATHFFNDVRSLGTFFFGMRGKHWAAWYDKTFLKPCQGVGRAMNDIGFLLSVFFLSTWYFTLNLKAEALITVHADEDMRNAVHVGILVPPIFTSFVYCALVVLVESLAGCSTAATDGLANAQQRVQTTNQDKAAAARHKARQQGKDLEAGVAEKQASSPMLSEGFPLAISALVIILLDVAEAAGGLFPFYVWADWRKALMAGLILKWGLLSICVYLAENMLPLCVFRISLPLGHWVRAHRMARDMIVSLVVVLPQLLIVALVAVNERLCPGCGAHQLLIYRDPGTVERQEKVFEVDF